MRRLLVSPTEQPKWADDLCQPLPIAAILLLALNDHVGKGLLFLPEIMRGKLSDVAGLFFFPVLLFALVQVFCRRLTIRHRATVAWLCALATSAVFAAIKTSAVFNELAARFWGAVVLDGSDLFALPVAALAVLWMLRRQRTSKTISPAWARLCVLGMAGFFSVATSPGPRQVRAFPEWRIVGGQEHALACATARTWVSKTGKQGMGVTLRVSATHACAFVLQDARLTVDGQEVLAVSLPPAVELSEDKPIHAYLAFPFDGEAVWNRNVRVASLRLVLASGSDADQARPLVWELPLEYRLDSAHAVLPIKCKDGECQDCLH